MLEVDFKNLPQSRIEHEKRRHFVLVNSQHYVRYLIMNEANMMSMNHTSAAGSMSVSNTTMA